jgi:uncharacterized protein involved in exopolysaccharide biosynthesis
MISAQGIDRIRAVLIRRKLSVLVTTAVVLGGAALFISTIEPAYRASAVLRALESQPAKDYVLPTVAEQVGERLKTLRLSLMARPGLIAVVDELHLDQAYGRSREEVVEAIRARMDVKVEGEDTFLLTFEDSDPVRAREVVNRMAEHFVARQVAQRTAVATATQKALSDEVAHLKPELATLERKVRDFKLAHYGSLPEQQEENLRTLDQTTMELNIQTTNLDYEEEHRRQLLLAAVSPMRHQEEQLTTTLHEALTRYTPEHPEVQRIRAELERLRGLRLTDEQRLRADADANPELTALSGSIARSRSTIAALRKRQAEVRARLAGTAKNGQDLLALSTDLEAVRLKYQGAIGKLHEAELSTGIERGLRGLRYDTIEAASQPLRPARPNRPLLAAGAVLLATLAGLGMGFLRELSDTSIHAPEDVAALGQHIDVLASVPDEQLA